MRIQQNFHNNFAQNLHLNCTCIPKSQITCLFFFLFSHFLSFFRNNCLKIIHGICQNPFFHVKLGNRGKKHSSHTHTETHKQKCIKQKSASKTEMKKNMIASRKEQTKRRRLIAFANQCRDV